MFLTLGFIAWSFLFIYRTSFVAVDGNRYFCLFDDAMISLRYAWNLVQGNGLVWNVGERVEGYTNFLMTIFMALPAALFSKSAACLCIQLCGIGFMLFIAYGTMMISNIAAQNLEAKDRRLVAILSFAASLSYYPLTYFSLMGVETGLLTLLLVFAVLSLLKFMQSGNTSSLKKSSLLFALAFLTRSDSFIFFLLALVFLLWNTRKKDETRTAQRRLMIQLVGLYALFVCAQFLFRYAYYGEILPNTYFLKVSGLPLFIRISDGWIYSRPFLLMISPMLALALWMLAKSQRADLIFFLSIIVGAVSYQIFVGGDPWDYWRFTSPAMPFLFIIFILSIVRWVRSSRLWIRVPKSNLPIILMTVAGLLLANSDHVKEQLLLIDPYQLDTNEMNTNMAIVIQKYTFSQARVGVLYAGALPFFSERYAIDFLGKSDKYIARLSPDISGKSGWNGRTSIPGHNKYDFNYSIKALQPDFVQSFVLGDQNLRDYRDAHYIEIIYRKIHVYLRDDSPFVNWEKISREFKIKRWDVGKK